MNKKQKMVICAAARERIKPAISNKRAAGNNAQTHLSGKTKEMDRTEIDKEMINELKDNERISIICL